MNYRRQSYTRGNELSPKINETLNNSGDQERRPRDYLGEFAKSLIVGGLAAICFGLGANSEPIVEYEAYGMIAGAFFRTYQTAVRKK